MIKAINNYYDRLIISKNKCIIENKIHKSVNKEITTNYLDLLRPIKRKRKSNTALFKREFGFDLPEEIEDYINIYWHTYIFGSYKAEEPIMLIPVLKLFNESDDDVLYNKSNGIITISKQWSQIGNIYNYIPIGWLRFSATWVLYNVKTSCIFLEDAEEDGKVEKNPIAKNLKDLISNLDVNCTL